MMRSKQGDGKHQPAGRSSNYDRKDLIGNCTHGILLWLNTLHGSIARPFPRLINSARQNISQTQKPPHALLFLQLRA